MRSCGIAMIRSLGLVQSLEGAPATRGCWGVALALFFLSGVAVGFSTDWGTESARMVVGQSLIDTGVDLLLIGGYFGLILRWRARLGAASPFFLLTIAVLALLGWVLAALWSAGHLLGVSPDAVSGWYAAAILLLFLWNLMAVGQLARHALNLSALLGLLVALGYFVLSGVLISALNTWLWPGQS